MVFYECSYKLGDRYAWLAECSYFKGLLSMVRGFSRVFFKASDKFVFLQKHPQSVFLFKGLIVHVAGVFMSVLTSLVMYIFLFYS